MVRYAAPIAAAGPLRRCSAAVLAGLLLLAAASLALPPEARGTSPAPRVAIIVGPVGEELTPVYIELADEAARTAVEGGATVATAYSPDATPENVLAAVAGANVVVYFGHGNGYPNPYGPGLDDETQNGWALQGPNARGTHEDSVAEGTLRYYGAAWIAANARPAPGFVMIYSNACYAPGASEDGLPPATEEEAEARAGHYSRILLETGASAVFATDFYLGAAGLVSRLLAAPERSYGEIFADDPNYAAEGLRVAPHPFVGERELWLHQSTYFDGVLNFWYAFAGDSAASPALAWSGVAPLPVPASGPGPGVAPALPPRAPAAGGEIVGMASSYPSTPGHEGQATIALPVPLGGAPLDAGAEPETVTVCGDRCVVLPVVDSCPCFWGSADQRVANLSHAAWALVTEDPLAEGLTPVSIRFGPAAIVEMIPHGGSDS